MSVKDLRQFGRQVRLVIGKPNQQGRSWTDLRVNALVTKTDSKKPNKATIQVYNLNEDSRGYCQQDDQVVLLYAGYNEPELIFQGDIDESVVQYNDRDIVLEIEAADGRRAYQEGSLFQTFEPPLTTRTLLTRLANAMGLNIASTPVDMPNISYLQGYTVAGPARDAIDDIARSVGVKWSIQDGELIFTMAGQGTTESTFLVSPSSGLVGTPERTKKGVRFQMLLNAKIRPRRPVALVSRDFNMFVIPKKVEHAFDTGFDTTFYTSVEAVETGTPATELPSNG